MSSSTLAFSLLLHPMVHSNTSNHQWGCALFFNTVPRRLCFSWSHHRWTRLQLSNFIAGLVSSTLDLQLHWFVAATSSREHRTYWLWNQMLQSAQCCRPPWLGPTIGSIPIGERATLVGPMLLQKELHYRLETTLSISVTLSGIHSYSKTSNWIKYINSHPRLGVSMPYIT